MRDTTRDAFAAASPSKGEAPAEGNVRERILAAAARLLARRGFQRTTLADVSLEAGVARAEVYRFFSNMNEVFEAILEAESARMLKAVVPSPGPKKARLRDFFRRQAEMVFRKPAPDCLVVLRLPEARSAALAFRAGMVRALTEMLCEILETDSLLVRTLAEGHFEFLKVLYRKVFLDRNSYIYVEAFADYACELFVLELRHLSSHALLKEQEELLGLLGTLGEEKNDKSPKEG